MEGFSFRVAWMSVMLLLAARPFLRPCRAFLHGPSVSSLRSARAIHAPLSRRIFMSASTTDLQSLQEKIRIKGDEIRRLKAEGIDKLALAPHIEELVALKSQLPPDDSDDKKDTKKPKKEPQKQSKKPAPATKKAPEAEMTTSELRANRLAKVTAMRQAGVEPFEYSYRVTHTAQQLAQAYEGKLEPGEEDTDMVEDVSVAGRVMTRRVFGKLAFFTVQDDSGLMQIQFDKNRLGDAFPVSELNYFLAGGSIAKC